MLKSEDVHVLLKSHEIEFIAEELYHLQEEKRQTLADDLSSDEDEETESIRSSLIEEMCTKWGAAVISGKISSGHHVGK